MTINPLAMVKKYISLVLSALSFCFISAQISFSPSTWSVNTPVTVTYSNPGAAGQTQNLYIHQAYDTDNDPNVWEYTDTWYSTGLILTAEGGGNPSGTWTGTLDLDNTTMETAIPDGSTIYDILFVVRDDGGNNWTGDITYGNGGIIGVPLPEIYDSTLSIGEVGSLNPQIKIIRDVLTIHAQGHYNFKIYNLNGKLVFAKSLEILDRYQQILNISPNTLYILELRDSNGLKHTRKFVITE